MDRDKISRRVGYEILLRYPEKYLEMIERQLSLSVEEWSRMDRLDRAISAKVAHFLEFYVDPFGSLPTGLSHLDAQYSWIGAVTAIESVIGSPPGIEKRLFEFFKSNLDKADQLVLASSIKPVDLGKTSRRFDLKRVIKELVFRRHGYIHRAELVNLPNSPVISANFSVSTGKGGRKGQTILVELQSSQIVRLAKKAIRRYLLTPKSLRSPVQDFRIKKHKSS